MKTILTAALAFVALTSTALADGAVELTDAQMDKVTAGGSYGSPGAGGCGDGSCNVGGYSNDGLTGGGGYSEGTYEDESGEVASYSISGGYGQGPNGQGGNGHRVVIGDTTCAGNDCF